MKKALVLVAMIASVSAQADALGGVSARLGMFLRPLAPGFQAAYPCGKKTVFVSTESVVRSTTTAKVVCQGSSKNLVITREGSDGSLQSSRRPLSQSAYLEAQLGAELRTMIQTSLLNGAEVDDESLTLETYRASSTVISGVTYPTTLVKILVADEGETIGFAEMEFAAGLPRGEEMISYSYSLDLGQLGGAVASGSYTQILVPGQR